MQTEVKSSCSSFEKISTFALNHREKWINNVHVM